ncbi:hypothetical protein [Nostoc sp.]
MTTVVEPNNSGAIPPLRAMSTTGYSASQLGVEKLLTLILPIGSAIAGC